MNLIAHRGIGENENTLEAFERAIKSDRTAGFECDIRLSKDNKIVVIHDSFVDRVFKNKHGLVKEKTAEELGKLGVPTLKRVLSLHTDKIIMIEVKEIDIDPSSLVALLETYVNNKNIYLMSFHSEYMHKILKYNPKFKVGMLHNVFNKEINYDEYDFIGIFSGFITDDIIKYFKNKNIELFIFGIDEHSKAFRDYYQHLENVYLIVDL